MVRRDCRRVRRSADVSRETLCVDIPLRISACSCARVPLFRKARHLVKGACRSLRHDRHFGSRAVHFRMASGIQAGDRDHRDHGDVARKGRGICGRRAVRGGLEFLFWTGTVDSVSDARMGADRLFGGRACGTDEEKPRRAVRFRRGGGGDVFAAYGHLDGAVGRRYVQPRALRRRGRIGAAGNCGICGVKRDLPFDSGKPHRRKARENEEKIRTVCVGLAQARRADIVRRRDAGRTHRRIKRGAFGPRFILQKNRKLSPRSC